MKSTTAAKNAPQNSNRPKTAPVHLKSSPLLDEWSETISPGSGRSSYSGSFMGGFPIDEIAL